MTAPIRPPITLAQTPNFRVSIGQVSFLGGGGDIGFGVGDGGFFGGDIGFGDGGLFVGGDIGFGDGGHFGFGAGGGGHEE